MAFAISAYLVTFFILTGTCLFLLWQRGNKRTHLALLTPAQGDDDE